MQSDNNQRSKKQDSGKKRGRGSLDQTASTDSESIAPPVRNASAVLHPVVRIYYLQNSAFSERTYFFNSATGVFALSNSLRANSGDELVGSQTVRVDDRADDVRRVVFFEVESLTGSENVLLVADVSPGGKLRVADNWKKITLDAELLCPLTSANKVDFDMTIEVKTVGGVRRPIHTSFNVGSSNIFSGLPSGITDRLKRVVTQPLSDQHFPPLEHNGFNSGLLKRATGLSLPEFDLPSCTDPTSKLKTVIHFELNFAGNNSFKVITFRLSTPDSTECDGATARSGFVRTFWDDSGFEYFRGEAPQRWNFLHRPAKTTGPTFPAESLIRGASWILHAQGVPTRPAARSWNRLVSLFHIFLIGTQGAKAVSFLPLFDAFENEVKAASENVGWWMMTYELIDGPTDKNFIFLDADAQDDPLDIGIRPLSLHFIQAHPASPPAAGECLPQPSLCGSLPQVRVTTGTTLAVASYKLLVPPNPPSPKDERDELIAAEDEKDRGILLNIIEPSLVTAPTPNRGEPQAGTVVRIGALDLEFGQSTASGGNQNHLRLSPSGKVVLVDADTQFFIKTITPGGQDYPVSEEFVATTEAETIQACIRPKPPIVIPLEARDRDISRLLLHVHEEYRVKIEPPHELTLDLISQTPKKTDVGDICRDAERLAVVLDRNPFMVAEVRYTAFDRLTSFAGSKIATWDSSQVGSRWDLLFEEQPFCLVLPPQAVGEEMIKNLKQDQNVGDKALPFNLGPPTVMEVDARQVRTNFAEAPWNLRRILGTRGEQLAGPLVRRIHYELLYGLTGDAQNPGIRLADVFSQAGRIAGLPDGVMKWAGTQDQIDAYTDSRVKWSITYARYLARAAVLVPWNQLLLDPNQPPVVLSESLSTRLRLPPLSNMKSPIDPDPGQPDGTLRGGATWGFESKNIYKAVLDNQPSSSARLEEFSFSALGGWGEQHAGFQNDLTRISADVAMGRTFRYKVERLGRIACVWPLAKHVIIYERSVVPSRQFNDPDQPLAGWPVVRKVEEYVELLEDKRTFPDDEQAKKTDTAKRTCGFVTNCTFQPRARFNVKGSWGSDVEDYGWKIPLWRPGAQPADLYPKPDVSFGIATNLKNEQGDYQCDLDNPDNLYFFTLTRDPADPNKKKNPDPDPRKWPPILDIDFVNAPRPIREEAVPSSQSDFKDGDPRATSPTDSPVPPLYGHCTFRLKPASIPADIVAGRAGQAMAAVIQTVTLVRSVEGSQPPWPAEMTEVREIESKLTEVFNRVIKDLPLDSLPTATTIDALRNRVSTDFAGLQAKVTAAKARVAALKANLKLRITSAENAIFARLKEQFDLNEQLGKRFSDAVTDLKNRIDAFPSTVPIDKDKARQLLIEHQHQLEELFLLATSLPGVVPELLARYVDLVVGLAARLDDALARADSILAGAGADIEQVRKELTAVIQSAREMIAAFDTLGRTTPLPFLPDPTAAARAALGDYLNHFEEAANQLLDDLHAAANVTAARAAIARFRQSAFFITLHDKTKLRQFIIDAFGKDIDVTNLDQLREAIHFAQKWRDDLLDKWRLKVREAVAGVNTTKDELIRARDILIVWLTSPLPAIMGLQTQLQTLKTEIDNRIDKAADEVLASLDEAIKGLDWSSIQGALTNILGKTPDKIQQEFEQLRDRLADQSRSYFEHAARLFKDNLPSFQQADPTLRLIRAFGEPPRVPKLDFDRSQIAYFFKDALPEVDLTPVAAIASQAASLNEKLKPLGVRLPTKQTVEQFIPVELRQFDLTRIFPNFAGLDLRNLFSGLKLDNVGRDNVKITHGLDEQTRRAFVRADVAFHLDKEATMFTLGPLILRLKSADFRATSIVEAGIGGQVSRKVYGSITGTWELVISSIALLRFTKTELRFDDASGIKFSINPRGIELPEILSFLSDLVSITGGDGQSGLTIALLPNGVQSVLSLPLPDIQAGAFGISNLRLSAIMALLFDDEFTINLGFALARRDAPFALTIFILGGGGFFEVIASYRTRSRKLTCRVDLGVTVSASLAIALGPIKGGVYVYFGITATYQNDSGLAIGVLLVMGGEVSVLGIVSASITLTLEASYNTQDKSITGRGRLSIKIKICWCFTLEVSQEITYTLGKSSGRTVSALPGMAPEVARPETGPRFLKASFAESPLAAADDEFTRIARAYLDLLV